VVNWNSGALLARIVDSLSNLSPDLERILIVDNASETIERFEVASPIVEIERLDRNLGFAGGANLGIERSNSRFVLLVNPDIVVDSDCVRNLYRRMDLDSKCAIACGALCGLNGSPQNSFQIRRLPAFLDVVSDALFIDELKSLVGIRKRKQQDELVNPPDEGIEVEQPAAAFWMVRKKAWESVGGFDEQFFPAWWEDVDFCKRILERGWTIRFFPQYRISHEGGYSLGVLGYFRFVRIFYRNLLRYWRKHHRSTYPIVWLSVKTGLLIRRLLKDSNGSSQD
jgi:GT2 family glycosyltransferase